MTFFPGSLPEDLSPPLPEDARVLGSAEIAGERTVAALEIPADRQESLEALNEVFETVCLFGSFAGRKVPALPVSKWATGRAALPRLGSLGYALL